MWVCAQCREEVDDIFTECWYCGHSREGIDSSKRGRFQAPKPQVEQPGEAEARFTEGAESRFGTDGGHWSEQFGKSGPLVDMREKRQEGGWRERVEKRPTGEGSQEAEWPRSLGWARLKAFLMDYLLFLVLWGVIDNLVAVPIPAKLMELASVVLFCFYYMVIEGSNRPRASWGKRWQGLMVVTRTGEQPGIWVVGQRALLVASFVIVDWSAMLDRWSMPDFAKVLAVTIPAGIVLYNLLLARRSAGGLMLQDRLTGTKVVWADGAEAAEPTSTEDPSTRSNLLPEPWLAVGSILFTSMAGVLLSLFFLYNLDSDRLWQVQGPGAVRAATVLEEQVAAELGIRSVAKVYPVLQTDFSTSGPYSGITKKLVVEVWLPLILWNEETRQNVLRVAVKNLKVKSGYWDSGEFIIKTGRLYRIGRTAELNMP